MELVAALATAVVVGDGAAPQPLPSGAAALAVAAVAGVAAPVAADAAVLQRRCSARPC